VNILNITYDLYYCSAAVGFLAQCIQKWMATESRLSKPFQNGCGIGGDVPQ